jgi:hypothetical protein
MSGFAFVAVCLNASRKLHYGQYFEAVVLRNERPPIPPGMPEDYSLLMTTW